MEYDLDARVLSQLLVMQSVVITLPDDAIIPFVINGLDDIPGIKRVEFLPEAVGSTDSTQCFPLKSGSSIHGCIVVTVDNEDAFFPYLDHLRNFSFMLAVILEERRQRQSIELMASYLENQVEQRTAELSKQRDTAQRYLDVADVMMMALDRSGQIAMINNKGASLLGMSERALIGIDWFETFIPAEERAVVHAVFDHLMSGEAELFDSYENRIVTHSGQ